MSEKSRSRYLLTKISNDVVRYLLIQDTKSGTWTAEKQVATDDRWHTCWYSTEYPNRYGARTAIRCYLGL